MDKTMHNAVAITLYSIFFIFTIIQITVALIKYRTKPIMKYYFLTAFSVAIWQVINLTFYFTLDFRLAKFVFNLALPFVTTSNIFVLRIFHEFYKKNGDKKANWAPVYIIPIITSVLCLTSPYHNLIRKELTILQTAPKHIVINIRGEWFWIHAIFNYLLMIFSIVVVLKGHLRVEKYFRNSSYYFVFSMVSTIFFNMLYVFGFMPIDLDFTLIAIVCDLYLIYLAINYGDKQAFLIQAQKQIFDRLNEGVFILDEDNNIIGLNKFAEIIFQNKIDEKKIRMFSELEGYMKTPFDKSEYLEAVRGDGCEVFILDKVYKLKEHEIFNKKGKKLGAFVVFTDVTKYKQLISQLEEYANVDAITGLFNRHAFEIEKFKLKDATVIPFSIVMGDLNFLKHVNDTFGHDAGDDYIKLISRVLIDCTPTACKIYRIGGDEFVILLPNINALQTSKIIDNIERTISLIKRFPYDISISLGFSTITSLGQSIDKAICIADEIMYNNKRILKEQISNKVPHS